MARLTIDQLADRLAPISKYPNYAVPECAIRCCSDECTSVMTNGQEVVFLCDHHDKELRMRLVYNNSTVFGSLGYRVSGLTRGVAGK